MKQTSANDVQVREIQRDDLPYLVSYFFESSPEFLNSIGLKTPEPGEAEKFKAMLEGRFLERENGGPPLPVLTVFYKGERIGFHTSTHRDPPRTLIMHAHFFRPDMRGKGIGTISYVLALEKFLVDCGYEEVIFKTPIQNAGPMKIKEKLGLKPIGEEIIDWPQLVRPLPVKVYRVVRTDLQSLKARVGL